MDTYYFPLDIRAVPPPPVMTDGGPPPPTVWRHLCGRYGFGVTAWHRQHFRDVLYSFLDFFNTVDNFNVQCKHQQIIKMSSNEQTCFYINEDICYLFKYKYNAKQLRTCTVIPAHKFVKYRYIKYVATVTFKWLLPLRYGQVSRRRAADKICNI